MKNEEQYSKINYGQLFKNNKKDVLIECRIDECKIKCKQGKQAFQFCFRSQCQQRNSFTCGDYKCKCNIIHKKCQKANIYMVIQTIKCKLQEVNKLKQQISDVIDKQIQILSNLRENIRKQFDEDYQFFSLSKMQIRFYKLFYQEQKVKLFTSKKLSQLWGVISLQKDNYISQINQLRKDIEAFSAQITKSAEALQQSLHLMNEQLVNKSSIINSSSDYKNLLNFFAKRPKLTLVFKASANNFNLCKYEQMIENTTCKIILCKNQHNKILGGYTSLKFNNKSYQIDYDNKFIQNKSFLFSLNTNEKFPLKNKKLCLNLELNKQFLQFGQQFHICNYANIQNKSYLQFIGDIYDPKYQEHLEYMQNIIGHKSINFLIKEWEVLKVQF